MDYTRAVVRPPPPGFAGGLTVIRDGPPDVALALTQHRCYCQSLTDCGLTLTALPTDPSYPDCCFVEDVAIVTARGAIATRPGAPSRRGEVDSIVESLRGWFPDMGRIAAPGTLDGGDVCEADGHFLIGLSGRTNEDGARQLARFLDSLGYSSSVMDIRCNRQLLHLKSGLSYIGDGRVVVVPEMSELEALRPYEIIVVADEERYAANCLRISEQVLIAAQHPRLAATLADLGCDTVPLDLSEFRKMDGSLTCLSLRF
jgi:dimethylargininase